MLVDRYWIPLTATELSCTLFCCSLPNGAPQPRPKQPHQTGKNKARLGITQPSLKLPRRDGQRQLLESDDIWSKHQPCETTGSSCRRIDGTVLGALTLESQGQSQSPL